MNSRFAPVEDAFELPCIRCGACVPACPAGLQPHALLWDLRAGRLDEASAHGLSDCRDCADCDRACPSRIALSVHFRTAKFALEDRQRLLAEAALARQRFELRNLRLQRDATERAEREARLADASSTDAVAAAIERARARRSARDQP